HGHDGEVRHHMAPWRRSVAAVLVLVAGAFAVWRWTGRAPAYGDVDAEPPPPVPNIVLQNQDGRSVRLYDDLVKGHVVMMNFMFTTCRRACPGTTANLVKVQRVLGRRVGRDVVMLSISLDPDHDTPPVLREYARLYGVQPGWQL